MADSIDRKTEEEPSQIEDEVEVDDGNETMESETGRENSNGNEQKFLTPTAEKPHDNHVS